MVEEPPHSQYSPFILVSNLRAHLYVALEKNAWLQKRIEELEEERNFLRCQLDRFILSMRSSEGEDTKPATVSFSILIHRNVAISLKYRFPMATTSKNCIDLK